MSILIKPEASPIKLVTEEMLADTKNMINIYNVWDKCKETTYFNPSINLEAWKAPLGYESITTYALGCDNAENILTLLNIFAEELEKVITNKSIYIRSSIQLRKAGDRYVVSCRLAIKKESEF